MRPARLALVVVLVLFAALLHWRTREARPLDHYTPEGYVDRANAFIRAGYLEADCSGEEPRLEPRLDRAPEAEADWYRDSYLSADVARFNSDPDAYLWTFDLDASCRLHGVNPVVRRVVLPFADAARWLGSVYYGGGGSAAALRSPRRTLTLRRPDREVPTEEQATTPVGAGRSLTREGSILLHFRGGPEWPAARIHAVGGETAVRNRVKEERVEDRLLLQGHRLPIGASARLETGDWLHAESALPAPHHETFVFLGEEALDAASVVQLRNERYERRTHDADLGVVPDPTRTEPYPFLELLVESVDASLSRLPEERARLLADGFDLQLTVDRPLQESLGEAFREAVRERRRSDTLPGPFGAGMTVMDARNGDLLALATYPLAADLTSAERELLTLRRQRRLLQNQNLVLHPIGSAGKPFLFAAVADAYPFLLGLVIDEHPEEESHRQLLQCRLPAGYQLLAGHYGAIDFPRALEMSCNQYTVDLAVLALAAYRGEAEGPLAARIPAAPGIEWPLPGDRSGLTVGGSPLTWAPDLDYFFDYGRPLDPRRVAPPDGEAESGPAAVIHCNALDRLEQAPFREPLENLVGTPTYRGSVPTGLGERPTDRLLDQAYLSTRYDLHPWAPLVEHLTGPLEGHPEGVDPEAAWAVRTALQSVAPERVNLAFNQITRLREDFVSMVLGGGTSTWTNVQLAEALSRLVTGRAVEARLADRVLARGREGGPEPVPESAQEPAQEAAGRAAGREGGEGGAAGGGDPPEPGLPAELDLPPELDLEPAARQGVLEGMRRVVAGAEGTAKPLRAPLARLRRTFPGDRVELYAKTGSPRIFRPVPRRTGPALRELVARGRLAVDGDVLRVRPEATDAGVLHPSRRSASAADRRAARDALVRALRSVGFQRNAGGLAGSLMPVLDTFAAGLGDAGSDPTALGGPLRLDARGRLYVDDEDPLFRDGRVETFGGVLVLTLVRVPDAAASTGGPLPVEELSRPDVRAVTVALHVDTGPDSSSAVEVAADVLPELANLLR